MKKDIRSTIITVCILLVLGILATLYSSNIVVFSTNLITGIYSYLHHNDTCSLGVYGTAANITLTGGNSECESIRELSVKSDGTTVLYVMTATPTGTVICEGDTQDGYHYIVRDTGLFDIVGNNLCSWMLHPAQGF